MEYQTERNSQDHLVIRGVPIFMDCQRDDMVFDRSWVKTAVAQARQAAEDNYFPPLHVHHHGTRDEVQPAGFFEITHAEDITFRGKERLAIMADLTITSEMVEWDVLQSRLPYRSVEILSAARPNIDSLALLNHSAPYLELPILDPKDPGPKDQSQAQFALATISQHYTPEPSKETDGVVACFQRGPGAALLFDNREREDNTMAAKKKTDDKPAAELTKKPVAMEADDGEKGDGKKEDGEKMEGEESAVDVGAICKAIEAGSISVADMDAIVAAIGAQKGAGEEGEVSDPTAVAAQIPGAAMSKSTSEKFARMQAKVDALEAQANARNASDKRRDDVAEAMKRLEGKPLGADLEGRLVKFHSDNGPDAFNAYVDETEANFAAFEGDLANDLRKTNPPTKTSKAVDKYAEDGPEALAKAQRFSSMWQQIHESGHTDMPEERYLAINMAR